MLDPSLTRQEKYLVMILRWWIVLFALAALGFIIFPDQILKYLNVIGSSAFGWNAPAIGPSTERFWLILTVALMTVLIISAIKAQQSVIKNTAYVKIIIISKLTSTIGFVAAFLFLNYSFAYLAGAAIDGFILFVTWFAYRRASASRFIR